LCIWLLVGTTIIAHFETTFKFLLVQVTEFCNTLLKALKQFGFGSLDVSEKDFQTPDRIIQLGLPPNRIDLLTTIPGVEFRHCFSARVKEKIDGVLVNFIDLENLKKNKKAVGRKQDLADLESLE
jgi:hypothetical protein